MSVEQFSEILNKILKINSFDSTIQNDIVK